MARKTGLTPLNETPSLWQRLSGRSAAVRWSRSAEPPVGAEKAGFYLAALESGSLPVEDRERIARCLLWCDAARASYAPTRVAWYEEAFRASPDDERSAFYIAALCQQGTIEDTEIAAAAYRSLLRPAWQDSRYWQRFTLPQPRTIRFALASLYASRPADPAASTAEAIEAVETALEAVPDGHPDRRAYIRYLCQVYRAQGRTDETAESVYRWVFGREPGDTENCRYLAGIYIDQDRKDGPACAVYGRLAALADERGDTEEAGRWTVRQARAYIALGRMDEGTIRAYERAAAFDPQDRTLAAAHLCALAKEYGAVGIGSAAAATFQEDAATVARLEDALVQEAELLPAFTANGWDWGDVLRALALAYGRTGRTDDAARSVYARAIWVCPDDRGIWALHARTLAEANDHSEAALPVYEKAIYAPNCNDSVFVALGHTYIACKAWANEQHRHNALVLWETLFRQGVHWPALIDALARAYTGEERVNEIALALWEKQVEQEPENGYLRLRLAQEMRLRGDLHSAMRYFREAARLLPKDFDAQYETGLLLKDAYSDYPNAIKLLQRAIKLPRGQKHLDAHFALGESLLYRDRRDEAQVIFQKIVDEISPQHTQTLLYLARLNLKYEEQGARVAERLYEQARALNPDNPETYRRMADLYREKGQSDEEEQALEKYLTLSEPDAEKYRQLADLYIRKGDFLRAESALRQVIALGRGDKRLYTLLGEVILQARGATAEAA